LRAKIAIPNPARTAASTPLTPRTMQVIRQLRPACFKSLYASERLRLGAWYATSGTRAVRIDPGACDARPDQRVAPDQPAVGFAGADGCASRRPGQVAGLDRRAGWDLRNGELEVDPRVQLPEVPQDPGSGVSARSSVTPNRSRPRSSEPVK